MNNPPQTSSLVLELSDVSYFFQQQPILQNIDCSLSQGTITTIVGANGAGKSTLLKCISGDIPISSGSMRYADNQYIPEQHQQALSRSVAKLSQFSLLNFPFTCTEVVGLGRIPHATGVAIDQTIVADCLAAVDMGEFANHNYMRLSGGEKQRVQIARILAQIWREQDQVYPRLLLLDEPCNSLDLAHQQQLMRLLTQLRNSGVTILLVLHDINLASRFSDKLIGLKQGHILFDGEPNTVITKRNIYDLLGVNSSLIWNDNAQISMVIPE